MDVSAAGVTDRVGRLRRPLSRAGSRWLALAGAIATLIALPSVASATTYPAPGGSGFDTDLQGWSSLRAGCFLAGFPSGVLCSAVNERSDADGIPKPAIATRFGTLVNAVGAFSGTGVWRSPTFLISDDKPEPAVLRLERRALIDAAIDQGGVAEYKVLLVDDGTGGAVQIAGATLAKQDQTWSAHEVTLPERSLSVGHIYHLEIITEATSRTVQALAGEISVLYDNISLETAKTAITGSEVSTARRLVRFTMGAARAARRGQFANEIRLRIYCRKSTVRRCEGSGKVRTAFKIQPGLNKSAPRRKVTLGTADYICPRGSICWIKIPIRDRSRRLARARGGSKGLPVDAQITVLDEKGLQQTLSKRIKLFAS